MYSALKKHHLLKVLIKGWLYHTELKVSYKLLKSAINYLKKGNTVNTLKSQKAELFVALTLFGTYLLKQSDKKKAVIGNTHHQWTQKIDENGDVWFSNEQGHTICKRTDGTFSTNNNLRG
jgi:hypothetical protein